MSKQLSKFDEKRVIIRDTLSTTTYKSKITQILPRHMGFDRFLRCIYLAITKNPDLINCTPQSIERASVEAAQNGLECDGNVGYLVPYKNKGVLEAQFIPSYKGLIKLAYQSKEVRSVTAGVVHQKDDFDFEYGSSQFIKHKPYTGPDDPGPRTYAWAGCEMANGGYVFVVLTAKDVDLRRQASMGKNSQYSPWNKYPEAMWKKSAVRELAKWIPQSSELWAAIENESSGMIIDGSVLDALEEPTNSEESASEDSSSDSDLNYRDAQDAIEGSVETSDTQAEQLSKQVEEKRKKQQQSLPVD